MSKKKCCCGGGEEPIRADCDITGCIRVTFSGISAFQSETAFINLQSPTSISLCRVLSLSGVNRTFHFEYPIFDRFRNCSEGYVRTQVAGNCQNPTFDEIFWNTGIGVHIGLVCIANRLRVSRLRLGVGRGGGGAVGSGCGDAFPLRFAGGFAFDFWPDNLGTIKPIIGFGTTIQNQNSQIWAPTCNANGTSQALALNGQARIEMFAGTCPSTPNNYAVAERCGDPASRISVDTAGSGGTAANCYYQGNLYRLTDDTTTAAPVAVTWTTDECPSGFASLINRGEAYLQASQIGAQAAPMPSGLSGPSDPAVQAHIAEQRRRSGCAGCGDADGASLI